MAKPPIAVIGAGLMGHGIAYLFAAGGHDVRVQDPSAEARDRLPERIAAIADLLGTDRTLIDRVHATAEIGEAVRDVEFVIEAAPEKIELKRAIFAELELSAPREAILATNTSAIPIARITAGLMTRERMIGAHFWNPPHLVPLVEIVLMTEENRPAAERLRNLLRSVGRHPVLVNHDIPGFIGNRLQHALKREAIALVAAGVCDAETVDDVVKLGFGARLAVLGPLEQSDLVGLDLTKNIHDTLMPDLDVTRVTHPYLEALVTKGDLGMKSGKGFREWTPQTAEAVRTRLRDFLLAAARRRD
jgi:3-hydroxybutyryl-CoA dehydrogenase